MSRIIIHQRGEDEYDYSAIMVLSSFQLRGNRGLVLLFSSGTAWSGDLQLFRIGTGVQLGVYYPIGDALARVISSSGPAGKMVAVAQTSGGSVANVRALITGDIEAGSGTLAVMRIVLKAHGLTETDLKPVYLKPEFTTDRLVRGKLEGKDGTQ